ncbi:hypothetical protein DWB61_09795 [Ancylomarina euxinus]|uniref:Uncharacterized protein n=1 Tax=Ancylomarina euxinus TaxID=2283627 RepID=A0A425Y1F2_9BACT|nr:hypothetical protein [Ancylomarina euxinus]MCZ4693780.1 hypothetical protein [Ancylomarina euxinus]MUP15140.1 hypothetical protein [Ancylomarina euxinus]RRG21563.1 hypothetical protein DWB61_09795 [Ancylomarina euxinus]
MKSTIKSYLHNLSQQINILISFFLENETLLSPGLIRILDQSQLELKDLLDLKFELERKVSLFEAIETVIKHPRYFMSDSPKKLVETYSQEKHFRRFSPVLNTFMVYANDIAKEMLNANHQLVETLPPLYQNILSKSRRNRREGFCKVLHHIIYEQVYPANLTKECHRITNLISKQCKCKDSFKLIGSSLNLTILT